MPSIENPVAIAKGIHLFPCPNTAVKPLYAESTRLETVREDRELPVKRERLHRKMQAFLCMSLVNGHSDP